MESLILNGLIDTGADVTIISKNDWPESYPTQPVHDICGLGGYEQAQKSFQPIVLESLGDSLR